MVDAVVALVVLVWAIRGFRAGTIAQVFSLAGLFAGLIVVVSVEKWVGAHWQGARPIAVFWVLRWLIALLAGSSLAALVQWWGESLGESVREGPLGWLDGAAGAVVGAVVGAVFVLVLVVTAVRLDSDSGFTRTLAAARTPLPLVQAGTRIVEVGESVLPGRRWLLRQMEAAESGIRTRRSS